MRTGSMSYSKIKKRGVCMVNSQHISANLRLISRIGTDHKNIRTFSGVRNNITPQNVLVFMQGVNTLMEKQATNAALTVRAELVPE